MDFYEKPNLFELVKSDDNIALVRMLLSEGANPNLENSRRESLLHVAAKSTEDNVEIVQELINAGAYVDRCNRFLYRPLHYAVIYRKRRVVEALLQTRIHINSKDSFGKAALHYAINNNYLHTVCFRDLPLHAQVPDAWIVRKILDHKKTNVNKRDETFETPLTLAVRNRHLEIVKLLLNHNRSNVDASNEYGQTPLHIALSHDDPCPYTVVLLLLKRASILKMNQNSETPLSIIINSKSFHFACMCIKVIAFNYNINGLLMHKLLKIPELSRFLSKCNDEINRMKRDIIANELTVFDFLSKYTIEPGFHNHILMVYKPIVERIITGLYPEYFCFLMHRISKSNLSAVLKCAVEEKYCKTNCGIKDCQKEHPTAFSEVFRIGLLFDYLSSFDIFRLIVIFSSVNIDESVLHIRHHECHLTDSWEKYPDE